MLIGKIKYYVNQLLEQHNTSYEIGVVYEVRPKRIAIVICNGGSSCSSCSASGGCCSGGGDGKKRIYADNIPHARKGDTVRVEIETTAGIADSQSFLYIIAFIMLALGLAAGYFIASLLPVGIPAALLSLLIGGAFMVGTMGVLRFSRPAVVQSSLAKICEIISAADSEAINK